MSEHGQQVANENSPPQARDLTVSTRGFLLMWGVPVLAILLTNFGLFETLTTKFMIAGALFWMGAGCVWNARRCGRVHCMFTGPWFLLAAFVPFLEGLGLLALDTGQWNIFSGVTFGGALVLWFVSENILGSYRG